TGRVPSGDGWERISERLHARMPDEPPPPHYEVVRPLLQISDLLAEISPRIMESRGGVEVWVRVQTRTDTSTRAAAEGPRGTRGSGRGSCARLFGRSNLDRWDLDPGGCPYGFRQAAVAGRGW